ncbi:unnamed protein product, partial [Ectocarpus sp. 12 AP-2014]
MCDSLDHVAEDRFPIALEFFEALVRTSEGRLGPLALQRTFRGLSFLCAYTCSSRRWVQASGGTKGPLEDDNRSFSALKDLLRLVCGQVEIAEEAREAFRRSRMTGTGPHGPLLATTPGIMAIPTWDTYTPMVVKGGGREASPWARTPDMDRAGGSRASFDFESSSSRAGSPRAPSSNGDGGGTDLDHPLPAPSPLGREDVHDFVTELVQEVIGSSVDMVELAKIMEMVLDVVKRHSSHSSEIFWRDVGDLGAMLFGESKRAHVSAFVTLAALCKMATGILRTLSDGELVARDLGNKILALQLIDEMLRATGEHFRFSRIFGYQVRRLVVSVVLANTSDSLLDGRCFRQTLRVASEIWRGFRSHCKVELAVLLDGFLLKTLRAPSPQMPPLWRVMVLDEFLRWFEVPNSLMEIFLNYDMDRKFTRQWKVFEQLVIILCAIAEGRGETALGSANVRAEPVDDKAQQTLRLTALRSLAEVMQRLTDAAGHGYVMSADRKKAEDSTATATAAAAAAAASAVGGHGEWDTAPSDGTRPSSPSARGGESDG